MPKLLMGELCRLFSLFQLGFQFCDVALEQLRIRRFRRSVGLILEQGDLLVECIRAGLPVFDNSARVFDETVLCCRGKKK